MRTKRLPLILDCDTGEDDAIAIVLSITSGLPLKYIITAHGNTTLNNATDNSSKILSLLNAKNVKIIRGADKPTKPHKLEPPGYTAGIDFLGNNGLCNVELPQSKYKNILDFGQDKYIKEVTRIIKKEGKIDYIITGPCTNFAKLCKHLGKDIKKHVNSLYIMGGAIYAKGARGTGVKNTSHEKGLDIPDTWAEFNFYCDPYAVKTVLEYDFNPTIVTWDQCINFELPFDYIRKMRSDKPGGKFIIKLMHAFMDLYGVKNKTKFELCDPLTIMTYMGFGKTKPEKINIVTSNRYFGKSYPDKNGYGIKYFHVNTKRQIYYIINEMIKKLDIEITKNKNLKNSVTIQVVGSINMDLITKVQRFPQEGETITGTDFLTAPGGKGANQAVASARLGAKTAMIGCVGIDRFGKELVTSLQKEKVSMRRINFIPNTPTGTASIIVNEKAQNKIIVIPGANYCITEDHLIYAWNTLKIKPQAVLLQLEVSLPIVIKTAQIAKNDNALVVLNPSPARFLPDELIKSVDFVIPNEHEVKIITGENDVEKAGKKLIQRGAKHVIITLGAKGALYINHNIKYIPSFQVDAVDPTAAGDAFIAAFTVAILQGKTTYEAIKFANAAGALTTTKIGAQPSLPYYQEISKFIMSQ